MHKVYSLFFYFSTTVICYFSRNKAYFKGIGENTRMLPSFYPGYFMRLYHDVDQTVDPAYNDTLCWLACKYDHLDLCQAEQLPGRPMVNATKVFAMNWRFFPTMDPQVFRILSSAQWMAERLLLLLS